MKEVYIQVKNLRHDIIVRNDPRLYEQPKSKTFDSLNQLGKLSQFFDISPDEKTYNELNKQVKKP